MFSVVSVSSRGLRTRLSSACVCRSFQSALCFRDIVSSLVHTGHVIMFCSKLELLDGFVEFCFLQCLAERLEVFAWWQLKYFKGCSSQAASARSVATRRFRLHARPKVSPVVLVQVWQFRLFCPFASSFASLLLVHCPVVSVCELRSGSSQLPVDVLDHSFASKLPCCVCYFFHERDLPVPFLSFACGRLATRVGRRTSRWCAFGA